MECTLALGPALKAFLPGLLFSLPTNDPLGDGRRERGTLGPALLAIWRKSFAALMNFQAQLSQLARANLVKYRASKSEPLMVL